MSAETSAVGSKPDEPHGRLRGATNPQGFGWIKPSQLGGTARAEPFVVWRTTISGNRVVLSETDTGGGAIFEQPHERSLTGLAWPASGGPRETGCVFEEDAWDRVRVEWRQLLACEAGWWESSRGRPTTQRQMHRTTFA